MIQPKLKTCAGCGEERVIWKNHQGNKFCKDCWFKQAPVKHPTPSRAFAPKRVSDKKSDLDKVYSQLRKLFLAKPENSTCRAKLSGVCMHTTGQDLTVHHTKGRGRYYLDTTTWIPLCLGCHEWVETHPKEAREMALSDTKH